MDYRTYLPGLTSQQYSRLEALPELYRAWNDKINVVSRKDMDQFALHHVLHSLSIARFISFRDGTKIMDLGTGGGLPGIPLAIVFPNCRFHLVDSIGKKLQVVDAIGEELGLKNFKTFHQRVETMPYQYDFIVTRAVAPASELVNWCRGKLAGIQHNELKNGMICLKGGNLEEELKAVKRARRTPVNDFFEEDYFREKYIVYIPGPFL